MAKKFTPPPVDEDSGYSPLAENVQEKNYSAPSAPSDPGPIPEPSFVPPSFGKQKNFFDQDGIGPDADEDLGSDSPTPKATAEKKTTQAAPQRRENQPIDPGYNEMSSKEKRRGAEGMANAFIQGYSILCRQGAKWVMIKPEKMNRLIMEGKIDASVMYAAPGNVMATAPDIVATYNEEMMSVMEVSEDFVNEVRPLLVRIFMKRGLGMSDEAQLMWVVGQDVFAKGVMLWSIKKQSSEFIKAFTIQNSAARTGPIESPETEPVQTQSAPVEYTESESMPAPEPQMAPVRPTMPETSNSQVSPTLTESSPEGFFDPVNMDSNVDMPKFGDPSRISGLAENERLSAELKREREAAKSEPKHKTKTAANHVAKPTKRNTKKKSK